MVLLERQSWQWSALSGGRHKENSLMLAQNQRQCTLERKKPTARYTLGRKLGLIDQFVVVVNRSSHDILVAVEDDPEATVETLSLKKRAVGCKAGVGVGVEWLPLVLSRARVDAGAAQRGHGSEGPWFLRLGEPAEIAGCASVVE